MMNKLLLFLFLAGMMLMPLAEGAYTATWSYPASLDRNDLASYPYLNLTLLGTQPGYLYNYTIRLGRNIMNGGNLAITGDIITGNFTGNGIKHVPINVTGLSYYPFDGVRYQASIVITEQHTGTVVIANRSFCLGPWLNRPHHIALSDSIPIMLDEYGGNLLLNGYKITMTGLHTNAYPNASSASFPVYIFITDNATARNLIAYNVVTAFWTVDNPINQSGTRWWTSTTSLANLVKLGTMRYYSSYYIYIGVPITDNSLYLDDTNTDLTIDATMVKTNFSINHIIANPHAYTSLSDITEWNTTNGYIGGQDHFIGAVVYVETVPSSLAESGWKPGTLPQNSFGVMLDNFGMMIGLPFFSLLIAFMVAAICAVIPWRFAIKYDFELPNFIYGFAVAGGMILNLVLTILSLWMFILFIMVIALVMFLNYRERIEGVLGFATGVPFAQRETAEAEPYREKQHLRHVTRIGQLSKAKQAGVLGARQTKALNKRLQQERLKAEKRINAGLKTPKQWWSKRQITKTSRIPKPFSPHAHKDGSISGYLPDGTKVTYDKNGHMTIKQPIRKDKRPRVLGKIQREWESEN